MIICYEMPRHWISYDQTAILQELMDAKASIMALTQISVSAQLGRRERQRQRNFPMPDYDLSEPQAFLRDHPRISTIDLVVYKGLDIVEIRKNIGAVPEWWLLT